MPADKSKKYTDYQTLSAAGKNGSANSRDQVTLKPAVNQNKKDSTAKDLVNPHKQPEIEVSPQVIAEKPPSPEAVNFVSAARDILPEKETTYAEKSKEKKKNKRIEKDRELLESDQWLKRSGHALTYIGLYLFSILVFFRPYELIPALSFLSTSALYFALLTLAIYIPTQLSTEGTLTILSTEVKCILAMTLLALVTMPIAKDPPTAWAVFNDTFIKAVLMFIVMVNVLRTRRRLLGLMWVSLSVGLYLSYIALSLYWKGEFAVEGYRVGLEVKGLFGNPNDLALHLVMMTPLAVALALASRNKIMRIAYFAMAALFIGANTVTFSRGGFLGLLASGAVLIWKLGRKSRLNISVASIVVGGLFILLAPGNYGLRILSIFIPGLDPVGSSDQRRELLIRSLLVTARNPWGIGIGNFPIVGVRNLVTHNAFTQVSSELGILGFAAYMIFMISPFRKLGAIERTLFERDEHDWFYYLAIGLQASIVGYMVSSFFVSVAYNWFIYYLIAYAVAFRRIYKLERNIEETEKDAFGLQVV